MNYLPAARRNDVVVQELDHEVLVYDLNTHKAFCLNETSAAVYMACDGFTSSAELRRKHKFTDDLINVALEQLDEQGLLEERGKYVAPRGALNRREALRKVAAASVIALPFIASVAAPMAIHAASVCGLGCGSSAACAPGCPTCTGVGTCAPGFDPCVNLGGACVSTGTCFGTFTCTAPGGVCAGPGVCTGAGGAPGTCIFAGACSVPGGACFGPGPCTANGTCIGAGTCV